MPIADDLREIERRATRDLAAVHDFFVHSKIVWQFFADQADVSQAFTVHNVDTGSRLDQAALIRLAPEYTQRYLLPFTFRQFVSALERFLFDLLHRILMHNPRQFGKSELKFDDVLNAANRDEIISDVIQKQLNELTYKNLREWFSALNKAVAVGCPSDDEIESLTEIKASRDILEHNAGVVNEVYLRKAGKKARYARGDTLEIDETYHSNSWRLISKVVTEVTNAAVGKLDRSPLP